MPDHLPRNPFERDCTVCAAVDAGGMQPHDKRRPTAVFKVVDAFNHPAVMWVIENDHVSWSDGVKKEGEVGNQHVIPLLISRLQAMPIDLNDFQRHSALSRERKASREQDRQFLRRVYTEL